MENQAQAPEQANPKRTLDEIDGSNADLYTNMFALAESVRNYNSAPNNSIKDYNSKVKSIYSPLKGILETKPELSKREDTIEMQASIEAAMDSGKCDKELTDRLATYANSVLTGEWNSLKPKLEDNHYKDAANNILINPGFGGAASALAGNETYKRPAGLAGFLRDITKENEKGELSNVINYYSRLRTIVSTHSGDENASDAEKKDIEKILDDGDAVYRKAVSTLNDEYKGHLQTMILKMVDASYRQSVGSGDKEHSRTVINGLDPSTGISLMLSPYMK